MAADLFQLSDLLTEIATRLRRSAAGGGIGHGRSPAEPSAMNWKERVQGIGAVEAAAVVAPDLIITQGLKGYEDYQTRYELLSRIAPTV